MPVQLLPTAFSFAEGHCVRLAVTGADSKHFAVDEPGPLSPWLEAGCGRASALHLPEIDHVPLESTYFQKCGKRNCLSRDARFEDVLTR